MRISISALRASVDISQLIYLSSLFSVFFHLHEYEEQNSIETVLMRRNILIGYIVINKIIVMHRIWENVAN